MIEDPNPKNWKQLQISVSRILEDIGLNTEIEKAINTPRGTVEIDVYAVDEQSIEKIKYIIECKNWSKKIPQSVVHSFTTVMNETGGHIGFIISQKGFQSGANEYLNHTNISGLTFEQFQKRYFEIWWKKHFCEAIGEASDTLLQYVEPINSRRERELALLPEEKVLKYNKLYEKYFELGTVMPMLNIGKYLQTYRIDPPDNIESFKNNLEKAFNKKFIFESATFRDLKFEISKFLEIATNEFNEIFGKNIFA